MKGEGKVKARQGGKEGKGKRRGKEKNEGIRNGEGGDYQVEKWEGGEGNKVSGNFIHP